MKRTLVACLALVAVLGAACASEDAAAKRPPRRTTTTVAVTATTTTVADPSTTVAPLPSSAPSAASTVEQTTSTVETTTTVPTGCDGPVTITVGGTYTGCYQSAEPSTPAVRIATTAPVTLDHATVQHVGYGIQSGVGGVQLTVTNSKITAADPGTASVIQRAINLNSPASLIAEHNNLTDGQGIWIGSGTPSVVRIRYNEVRNIGRYPHSTSNGCCVQFAQLTSVTSPGVEIAWNRTTNLYGQSEVEDNVNFYQSSGSDAAHPIDVHHNLFDGAWPRSGDGSSFTGSGALLGDAGGSNGNIHDNRVINTANIGFAVVGGSNNHLYGNRIVSDMRSGSTVVSATWSQGMSVWNPDNATMINDDAYDNSVALLRPDGRADWWLPACDPSTACTGNVSLPPPDGAAEQAERDGFAVDAANAGVAMGPDW